MTDYNYHISRDYHGIPAKDKETVMDMIRDGPKTTKQMAAMTDMGWRSIRNTVQILEGIGAVGKIGKDRHGAIIWGVKA